MHTRMIYFAVGLLALAGIPSAFAAASDGSSPTLTAKEIVMKSAEKAQEDFRALPNYSYIERDRTGGTDKTYRVLMIEGSPYQELVAISGKPLDPNQQKQEQRKLQQEIAKRKGESPSQRQQRIANYEKDRRRDNIMMQQLTSAFDFKLLRTGRLDGYDVYVLKATPKEDYNPPNTESEVLTGMEGMMWIDQKTFQWVKVTARVIHPVSIMGFLAQVQPGTRFELEKRPIGDGKVWAPSHFAMHANARILGFFNHNSYEDQTFSDYQPAKQY